MFLCSITNNIANIIVIIKAMTDNNILSKLNNISLIIKIIVNNKNKIFSFKLNFFTYSPFNKDKLLFI